MYVEIDNADALDMLMDRVACWTDDITTKKLYEQMYETAVYEGSFAGTKFNVRSIVDNDYFERCVVYVKEDEAYKYIMRAWYEGKRDVKGIGSIEAKADEAFLIRRY